MGGSYTTETFFRPREVSRERSALPASIHNALQLLRRRSSAGCVFIPIRIMQYLAVVDREEAVFVDSQGGYAHQDGEGGRLIRIAWHLRPAAERTSLVTPVPCEISYYFPDLKETQRRLVSEIQPALKLLLARRDLSLPDVRRHVVPFRRP